MLDFGILNLLILSVNWKKFAECMFAFERYPCVCVTALSIKQTQIEHIITEYYNIKDEHQFRQSTCMRRRI